MILHRTKGLLSAMALLGLGAFWALSPADVSRCFSDSLHACIGSLLPALFPFFVIGQLLMDSPGSELLALPLRPLCRLLGLRSPKAPLLLFLGWVGGYSALAVSLHTALRQKEISPQEGERLLVIGVISSPGFATAVGNMLGRPRLGLLLYGSTLAANLFCGLLLRLFCDAVPRCSSALSPPARTRGLGSAISGAVSGCLSVCGCVIFFRMALLPLGRLSFVPPRLHAALAGFAEVSSGCMAWAALGGDAAVIGCCTTMSLLSLSVWSQLNTLIESRCSLRLLLMTRPLHLAFSLLLLRGLLRLIPGEAPAFSTLAPRIVAVWRLPPDSAFFLFALCCLVLETLRGTRSLQRIRQEL